MKKLEIAEAITNRKARSPWQRGVKEYALELISEFEGEELTPEMDCEFIEKALLNGAGDWKEYSYGGCSLIYDSDIAERLCTPTELKWTKNGERNPDSCENWLDVQARALYQAFRLIVDLINKNGGLA